MFNQKAILLAITLLVGLSGATAALAAPPAWVEQGPGPILNAPGVQGLAGPNPAAGAINAIAADPTTADIVFVGTVNGGVWKTANATAANPIWTPLTDQQLPALSINSLAMSPVDPNTVFAGTGSTSFGRVLRQPRVRRRPLDRRRRHLDGACRSHFYRQTHRQHRTDYPERW